MKSSALRVANHPAQAEDRSFGLRRVVALARSTIRTRVHRAFLEASIARAAGHLQSWAKAAVMPAGPSPRRHPAARFELVFSVTCVCHPAVPCSEQRGSSGREWSHAWMATDLPVPFSRTRFSSGNADKPFDLMNPGSFSPRTQAVSFAMEPGCPGPDHGPRQVPGRTRLLPNGSDKRCIAA